MNKRRQSTEALIQATARRRIAEQADNAIEQAKFDRLVRLGVIVIDEPVRAALDACQADLNKGLNSVFAAIQQRKSMVISEGGGRGKAGVGCL